MADQTQMDDFNRGLCWAYRNPPRGTKRMKLNDIQKIVRKTNNKKPSLMAISLAARTYKDVKEKRGRKVGQRATTKEEDAKIMKRFKQLRPDGEYIDARILHGKLAKPLKNKIGKRTVQRRVNEKGYWYEEKNNKDDPDEKTKKKRLAFCRKHQDKDSSQWKSYCQGVADLKEFTYYPKKLQPKFKRVRCRFTYMNKKEKKMAKFQRPKRWFPKEEYKLVQKQWIFGLTTSTGKSIQFLVNAPRTGEQWAADIRKRVAPFLKRCFPEKRSYRILLDGESLLQSKPAKKEMKKHNISVIPDWPPHSPQLNPQEHVWFKRVAQLFFVVCFPSPFHPTLHPNTSAHIQIN